MSLSGGRVSLSEVEDYALRFGSGHPSTSPDSSSRDSLRVTEPLQLAKSHGPLKIVAPRAKNECYCRFQINARFSGGRYIAPLLPHPKAS
jgi:hypothetical protein